MATTKEQSIPPHWESIKTLRLQAERTIRAGEGLIEGGKKALAEVERLEQARREYDGACGCCGEAGHQMNGDVCADAEACVTRARRDEPGPSRVVCLDPDKMHGAADGFGGSDY